MADDFAMVMPAPGGPEGFERRAVDPGKPGPGDVLVRHRAVGLNFLDVYHRSGAYPWPVERDLVPGSEAAGVVEEVGEGVADLRPGDRVAYTMPLNAYATARVIPAHRLVKVPEGVEDEVAGSVMLKGLTVHYLIHSTFRVEPGMTVLVHAAAGGVGLLLGQWLNAKGARAIGTAGGTEKAALAREHGYAEVIDYRSEDFAERVRTLTDGRGVDVVYDSVGRDTWRGSLASLRQRGTFVCFGQSSGPIEGFGIPDLARGSFAACRPTLFHHIAERDELRRRADDLFAALADGTLRARVNQRVPLAEVAKAHRALEARETTGATVLLP